MKRFLSLAAVSVAMVCLFVSGVQAQGMGGNSAAAICPPAQGGATNMLAFCPNCNQQGQPTLAPIAPAPAAPIAGGASASASAGGGQRVIVQDNGANFRVDPRAVPGAFVEVPETTYVAVQGTRTVFVPAAQPSVVVAQSNQVQLAACPKACVGPIRAAIGNMQANRAARVASRAARNGANIALATNQTVVGGGGSSAASAAASAN